MSISGIKDIYSAGNSWKSVFDHVTGVKDDPGWSLAGLATDFVGMGQSLGREIAPKLGNTTFADAAATPIIEAGLLTLMVMSNTLGVGEPESGEGFAHGADAFNSVSETLASTHAPDSWDGDASGNYTTRNSEHQQRAQDLAQQDALIKQALNEQRVNVTDTRRFIDHRATVLTAAIVPALIALGYELPPGSGLAMSMEIQWAAFGATVPFCTERYGEMIHHAGRHATTIRRAGAGYDRVAQQANSAVT